ncbi:hypothetical protein ASZ90_009946 [hydrocarbon metagenome]|uniref:Uncharacterized protein n=1 Tax=hydrocarbon metagenome TaxID=938273 RepID=A0A0W8FHG4_9ZZZZ
MFRAGFPPGSRFGSAAVVGNGVHRPGRRPPGHCCIPCCLHKSAMPEFRGEG